jgi:MFS family permease
MAAGRFLGDRLVSRYGVKRILQASGIGIASGLLLSILVPSLWAATAGFLLVGLGVSSVIPIAYGLAGRSKTMSPSAALAAVSTISFLGFLLGPPVIGFIGHLWSLKWSFAVIALLGLGTTFLAGKVRET